MRLVLTSFGSPSASMLISGSSPRTVVLRFHSERHLCVKIQPISVDDVGARAGMSPARRAVVNRTRFAVSTLRASIPWRFCPHSRAVGGCGGFGHEKPHSSCDQAWPGGAGKAGKAGKAGYASYQQYSGPSCGRAQLGLGRRIWAEMARRMRIAAVFAACFACVYPASFSVSRHRHSGRGRGVLRLILSRKNASGMGGDGSHAHPGNPSGWSVNAAGDEARCLLAQPFIEAHPCLSPDA